MIRVRNNPMDRSCLLCVNLEIITRSICRLKSLSEAINEGQSMHLSFAIRPYDVKKNFRPVVQPLI